MSRISSLSLEYVRVRISAKEAGVVVDPTAATAEMAFVTSGEPESGDWATASWETDTTHSVDRYYARCLVGPAGDATLVDGTYRVWVRITGITPEIPVFRAPGNLIVT